MCILAQRTLADTRCVTRRQLCSALRVNGTVTKLNLNSNAISDQGVKYLASMLSDEKVPLPHGSALSTRTKAAQTCIQACF